MGTLNAEPEVQFGSSANLGADFGNLGDTVDICGKFISWQFGTHLVYLGNRLAMQSEFDKFTFPLQNCDVTKISHRKLDVNAYLASKIKLDFP